MRCTRWGPPGPGLAGVTGVRKCCGHTPNRLTGRWKPPWHSARSRCFYVEFRPPPSRWPRRPRRPSHHISREHAQEAAASATARAAAPYVPATHRSPHATPPSPHATPRSPHATPRSPHVTPHSPHATPHSLPTAYAVAKHVAANASAAIFTLETLAELGPADIVGCRGRIATFAQHGSGVHHNASAPHSHTNKQQQHGRALHFTGFAAVPNARTSGSLGPGGGQFADFPIVSRSLRAIASVACQCRRNVIRTYVFSSCHVTLGDA